MRAAYKTAAFGAIGPDKAGTIAVVAQKTFGTGDLTHLFHRDRRSLACQWLPEFTGPTENLGIADRYQAQ
ncbi:hypothetical protein [Crateriforma conspicua]|uniref:hypothetical protein n=1 Tax=Crateriforma conspicua TaxID=2527996 RepID=UPI001E2C7BC6|nr:hypothetical protein [Crateriforma conspicua]